MENNGALLWKVEKIVSKGEYNYAVVKEHPYAIDHGYVLHHRIVVENHLGRVLDPKEIVHHLNEDKKDNRIENLRVMTSLEHNKLHGSQKLRKKARIQCPYCSCVFIRNHSQTHLGKGYGKYTFCSRKCSAKFYRLTQQLEKAISVNILEIFYGKENTEATDLHQVP